MAGRGRFALIFFVFLILENARADPCNAGCSKGSGSGGFQKGTIYSYNLEGNTKVTLSGADRQDNGLSLVAEVQVVGLGNCANILKIKSLKITGSDGPVTDDRANIAKPVRFTLEDGKIGSEICAEAQDSLPSLNIKRAIISMLQTAADQTSEIDVFGQCPTTITSNKEGSGFTVTKIRDLNRCSFREQGKHDALSFMNGKALTGSNIMDGSYKSEAFVKTGIVEKSETVENYLYLPFSVDSAGAKAFVTSKLTLKNTNKGSVPANVNTKKSIIFENPHAVITEHGSVSDIQLALKTVTQSLGTHVEEKSAAVFSGLIKVLRISNKNDIQAVYNQIKGGSTAKDNTLSRRVYLDALFRAGSGDSVEVTIKLIQNKELSILEQNLAILSLATVLHVTPESIKAATSLLDVAGLPNEIYLAVGTLAGSYCRDHLCHGVKSVDPNIAALSAKLGSKISSCKATTKTAENSIIFALKAVKNIHHIEDSLIEKLATCASDKTVKPRVRVAALETFSADPCISKLQSTAISILKDKQQDSELRINAYLALLNCPNKHVADEIQSVLKTETIYQVGSFITSSLRNIRASTNPSRELAQKYFENIETNHNFPIDVRRYSQNYEVSYEHEMFGVGSIVDANIIYSQNSFLPRSASINLTTEVFGRNLNLVELGFRQGNLDRLFEEYFGPHGEFNTQTPQQIYNEVKKTGLDIMDKFKARMEKTRGKRSVLASANNFGSQLKTDIPAYYGDVDLDLFVKVLGSDSLFLSLGEKKESILDTFIDKFFDAVDSGMNEVKDISHELRNHFLLMDIEAGYPTSLGIALKLNLEGVSTSRVQFSSKIDFRQIIKDPKNAKIDIKVVPSANIELSGALSFDADLLVAGLKVATTLHSSTGSHVVAKIVDGSSFDVQIGLPIDKQELITVNHEILFITRRKGHLDLEKPAKFVGTNEQGYGGCFDQLSNAIAIVFCGDITHSWLPKKDDKNVVATTGFGPLKGPAKFYLKLDKADNLKGFHITGNYNTKHENQKTFEILLETQGTKTSRKVTFLTDLINKPELKSFRMKLDSPVKKVEFEGAIINNAKEKVAQAKVLYDESEYSAKAGVTVSGARHREIYKPIFDVKIPEQKSKLLEVSGTIATESLGGSDRKFIANNLAVAFGGQNFKLEGWWAIRTNAFETDIKLSEDKQMMTLVGKFSNDGKLLITNWNFHNTINPNIDFSMSYKGKHEEKLKSIDFTIVHGPDFKSKENEIVYSSSLKTNDVSSLPKLDFEFEERFSYPLLEAKYKSHLEVRPKKFSGKFEGKYGKYEADLESAIQHGMKSEKDFYGKLKAKINGNGFDTETTFKVTGEDKGEYTAKLEVYPKDKHEASGNVIYRLAKDDTDLGFSLKYKRSGKNEEYSYDSGFTCNPKAFNTFAKFSIGSVQWVDNYLRITKGNAPSGNLKLFVKNFVSGDGQFKVNAKDHKGNLLVVVEMLKTKRKIKTEGDFMFASPQYNANINIHHDFEKDSKKKITFTTTSKVQKGSIDSKNSLTIDGSKLDYTIKGDYSGDYKNGKQNGQITLSHSNGQSATFKLDRELRSDDKSANGHIDTFLTYVAEKGGKPYKLIKKGKFSGGDGAFNYEDQSTFVKPSGEEFDSKLMLKRSKLNKRAFVEGTVEISGALAPNTINSHITFDYNDDFNPDAGDLKYRIKGSYGPKSTIDASGTAAFVFDDEKDNMYQHDSDVTLTIPLEKAQNVKFSIKDYYFVSKDNQNIELKSNYLASVNADSYKYESNAKLFNIQNDNTKGSGRLFIQVPNHDKFVWDGNFQSEPLDGERKHCKGVANVEYGANQKLSVNFDNTMVLGREGTLKANILFPSDYKDAKKAAIEYTFKQPNTNSHLSEAKVDIDGKKYTWSSNVDLSTKDNPMIEFKGVNNGAKPYRVLIKGNALDKDVVEGVFKVENVGEFNLDMNVNAKVKSPEEFIVKLYIDCDKMKMNKVQVDASSESLNKGSKKIKLSATENGKNVLSGDTTYQTHNEGGKFIMEGSGSFKVKGEPKSTTFKYIRDKISVQGEQGDKVFLSVAVGEKNGIIEYKQTNLEYKFFSTYCEENKQCAHININNKLEGSLKTRLIDEFQVAVDLRKLGFVPEFGLHSKTELEKLHAPIHTFDMHLNLDKSKYHTQVYAKPVGKNYNTAFTVTMPQRIVSLESTTTYSDLKSKNAIFPFVHEVTLYTNKNADSKAKSVFKATLDKDHVANERFNLNGLILLTSPAIGKDLKITGKSTYDIKAYSSSFDINFDIFKKASQKVIISGKFKPIVEKEKIEGSSEFNINADGLGFNLKVEDNLLAKVGEFKYESKSILTIDRKKKEASVFIDLTPKKQKIYARVPSTELIKFDGSINTDKKGLIQMENTLSIYQGKPCTFTSELYTTPNYGFKISAKEQGGNNHVLLTGHLEVSKMVELKADHVEGGKTKPLVRLSAKLDGGGVKPENTFNAENIKQLTKIIGTRTQDFIKTVESTNNKVRQEVEKDTKTVIDHVKDANIDVKPVQTYFSNEFKKIRTELENDKALQQYVKVINEHMTSAAKIFADVMDKVVNIIQQSATFTADITNKAAKYMNENILPELSQIYTRISSAVFSVIQALVDILTQYVAIVSTFIEKHSADLKPLIDNLESIFNDFAKIVTKKFGELKETFEEFSAELQERIESLPIISLIREKIEDFKVPENLISIVRTVQDTIKPLIPNDKLTDFVDKLSDYIVKKIKKDRVDDVEEIKALINIYLEALESVKEQLNIQFDSEDNLPFLRLFAPAPINLKLFSTKQPTAPAISTFNYIMRGNIPSGDELTKSLRPRSLGVFDLIPPYKLRGIIAGGQHVFTFDGRHMTFPGSCRYVVSQDAVDGNFSIIINLEKGSPKSITLIDKSGSEVEVDNKGQLTYGGSPYGFPLEKADTTAWKYANTFSIETKYGAKVKCTKNLDVCSFVVSGYYLGKLRGLLGDGNNEPNDDFRLPNGIITTSESEFGNAYGLTSCPKIKTVDHSQHVAHAHHGPADVCENFFGKRSLLNACSFAVDISNYKQACQHATAGLSGDKAEKEACLIAKAYRIACKCTVPFMDVPKECRSCEIEGTTYKYDEKFVVKSPQKQADIVVAVETTKANEKTYKELVVPLISQIVDELKGKKIDDVKVYLVGVSPKMKYPIYYDTQSNKLQGAKIEFKNEQRSKPWESQITTDDEKVDDVLNKFAVLIQKSSVEFGLNNMHTTYAKIGKVELRPKAVKSIIMVHSEPCSKAFVGFVQYVGSRISEYIMQKRGIVTHLLAPMEIKSGKTSNVIGFSKNFAFVIGDKKRGLSNANLRSALTHSDDICAGHAENSNGNVYSTSVFSGLNAASKRGYTTLVSNTIVDSLTAVSAEYECKCKYSLEFTNKVSCDVVNRKDNRKPASKKK